MDPQLENLPVYFSDCHTLPSNIEIPEVQISNSTTQAGYEDISTDVAAKDLAALGNEIWDSPIPFAIFQDSTGRTFARTDLGDPWSRFEGELARAEVPGNISLPQIATGALRFQEDNTIEVTLNPGYPMKIREVLNYLNFKLQDKRVLAA